MKKKTILSCFSLLLALFPAAGQEPINRALQPDHLSNPHVNVLVEDEDGFIWAGTGRGLNRYNGSTFTYYYREPEGLSDDTITALLPDSRGRLWVGNGNGIQLMEAGRIDPAFVCKTGMVWHMEPLDEGHLLFSNRNGIFLMDKNTAGIQPVFQNRRLTFNSFILTSDGYLWIYDYGSLLMTVLDSRWRLVREFSLQSIGSSYPVEGLDHDVYYPSARGLSRYSSDGRSLDVPEPLRTLTRDKVVVFYLKEGRSQLVGIQGEGIFEILADGEVIQRWSQERLNEPLSCPPLLTNTNLWLSQTKEDLVNLFRNTENHFLDLPPQFAAHMLNGFHVIGDNELLVFTNTEAYRQDVLTGKITPVSGTGLQGREKIGLTFQDRLGNWWIQTNNYQLGKYRLSGNRMELLQQFAIETTNSLWDDASGNVYFLQEDGIHRILTDGSEEIIPAGACPEFWHCGQFRSGRVYFIADDDIWFLGEEGRFYPLEAGVPSPSCIYEDSKGKWWIGSKSDGLWQYDVYERKTVRIDLGDNTDPCIRSLSGDQDGNIWVALRFDFLRINAEGNVSFVSSPDNGISTNYTNSVAVMKDGTAVFGSNFRLTRFLNNRSQTVSPGKPIPLSLDNVFVNGKLTPTEELSHLNYRTEYIAFYFSGKNFDPDFTPVYQYKLEGHDKDWSPAGTFLRTRYADLRPGRYTFRVRVQQRDSSWSPDELTVPVIIKPSPWLSWPARLLYLFVLAGLGWFLIHQYIHFRISRDKLEISEQEKRLIEQISQERSTFFTNVSHEFRTPLSLIYGPVKELGKSTTLTEREQKLVSIIDRNSERMLRLTDQFLHFNQSRAIRDSLTVMRTDLTVLLRQMLRNFEYMFRQKNLQAAMDLPSELVVFCDREKVERIVFNLLSNAVKYTPEYGRILLSASQADGQAIVTVADTGIGISPDKMDRIFERYERLGEKVGDTLPSGFGIGLNYAKHLAIIHKGDLTAQANDPIGSIFTFAFPAGEEAYAQDTIWQEDPAQSEAEQETAAPASAPEGKKANLLIVEDNVDMRAYIRSFLQDECHVTMAGDGEEAWKLIRLSAPDLIVSDVMMPYKDGYTLCKELKNDAEYCHIPIILLTAKADMDNQLHGLELGADGYIGKPFDPTFLVALIRNLLANRKRMQGILSEQTATTAQVDTGMSPQDKAFLERCWMIIEEHLGEEDFNVTMLAMEVGMSRTSVYNKLTALTGQSPQAYLTNYRLNRAMELLKEHTWNIGEVAYKVGFSTHTGFSRAFKNKFGVPPSSV